MVWVWAPSPHGVTLSMRSKRFSSLAGWAAVALVAAVGFAAFGGSDLTADQVQTEAAAASLGHTAGAYAGLSFVTMGSPGDVSVVVAEADVQKPASDQVSEDGTDSSAGTTVSPSAGWLSEVEVRAFVSLHFEPADINRAVRIAWCESRFDPNHHDLKTGGVGLFNHLPRYWDERSSNAGFAGLPPTDAEASTAAAAWEVYNGGGWDVFNCRG